MELCATSKVSITLLVVILCSAVLAQPRNVERYERITGGQAARSNQFPHAVALILHLTRNRSSFCGGSIIHPSYVLTAAHCLDDATRVEVQAGITRIFRGTPQYRAIVEQRDIRRHPQYDDETLINDIGLIFLLRRIPLNAAMQVIALPSRADTSNRFVGLHGTVIGWGRFSDASEHLSDDLRYVSLEILSDRRCIDFYNRTYAFFLPSNMCISGARGSSCNGDSGGAMHIMLNGQMTIIGIVSYGSSTCESGDPPVMTRLTSYLDWVSANTGIRIL